MAPGQALGWLACVALICAAAASCQSEGNECLRHPAECPEGEPASLFAAPGGFDVADGKFACACLSAGGRLRTITHPLKSREGGDLHSRICLVGPANAPNVLYAITGVHGAEGFTGSAAMLRWLYDANDESSAFRLPPNTRYVFHHMAEPWGASHGFKENEDNIDNLKNLNQLFHDIQGWDHSNPIFDEMIDRISISTLDSQFEADPTFTAASQIIPELAQKYGPDELTKAMLKGQMDRQIGISFWGTTDSWSTVVLKTVADDYLAGAARIMVLDLHTAVGDFGKWSLYAYDKQSEEIFANWIEETGVEGKEMLDLNIAGVSLDPWPFYSYISDMYPTTNVTRVVWEAGTFPQEDYQVYLMLGMHCRFYSNSTSFAPEMCQLFNSKVAEYFYPASNPEYTQEYHENVSADTLLTSKVLFYGLAQWAAAVGDTGATTTPPVATSGSGFTNGDKIAVYALLGLILVTTLAVASMLFCRVAAASNRNSPSAKVQMNPLM